jgi:hypothetical protein
MRKRAFGLFCASLALAACAETDRTAVTPTISPTAAAVARKDCGTYGLSQGETVPETAYSCLIDAVDARRPARLQVTQPTTEGDPIPVTYIADAQGRVEVTTDSRRDSFGTQVVTQQMCSGPIARGGNLTFAKCSEPTAV